MDSPPPASAALPPLARPGKKGKKKSPRAQKPSMIKYAHDRIKEMLESLPEDTPLGTPLCGPDGQPVLLKRVSPFVLQYRGKTDGGGVLFTPWPQTPTSEMEQTLTKKDFDINTDSPLAALNHVRFAKTRVIQSVGPRAKAAKKWVERGVEVQADGPHQGKAWKNGKWCVPGESVSGHFDYYPDWMRNEYLAKYPRDNPPKRRKVGCPAPALAPSPTDLNLLPLPVPPMVPQPPAGDGAPTLHQVSSPPCSPLPLVLESYGDDLWGDNTLDLPVLMESENKDDKDKDEKSTMLNNSLTPELQASICESIQAMTKKQIKRAITRCQLKWVDGKTKMRAREMKECLGKALLHPHALYDCMAPTYSLLTKEDDIFMYTVPADTLRAEINKILRKSGKAPLPL